MTALPAWHTSSCVASCVGSLSPVWYRQASTSNTLGRPAQAALRRLAMAEIEEHLVPKSCQARAGGRRGTGMTVQAPAGVVVVGQAQELTSSCREGHASAMACRSHRGKPHMSGTSVRQQQCEKCEA